MGDGPTDYLESPCRWGATACSLLNPYWGCGSCPSSGPNAGSSQANFWNNTLESCTAILAKSIRLKVEGAAASAANLNDLGDYFFLLEDR